MSSTGHFLATWTLPRMDGSSYVPKWKIIESSSSEKDWLKANVHALYFQTRGTVPPESSKLHKRERCEGRSRWRICIRSQRKSILTAQRKSWNPNQVKNTASVLKSFRPSNCGPVWSRLGPRVLTLVQQILTRLLDCGIFIERSTATNSATSSTHS